MASVVHLAHLIALLLYIFLTSFMSWRFGRNETSFLHSYAIVMKNKKKKIVSRVCYSRREGVRDGGEDCWLLLAVNFLKQK